MSKSKLNSKHHVDSVDGVRRRTDDAVVIRKEKRYDQITKRRNFNVDAGDLEGGGIEGGRLIGDSSQTLSRGVNDDPTSLPYPASKASSTALPPRPVISTYTGRPPSLGGGGASGGGVCSAMSSSSSSSSCRPEEVVYGDHSLAAASSQDQSYDVVFAQYYADIIASADTRDFQRVFDSLSRVRSLISRKNEKPPIAELIRSRIVPILAQLITEAYDGYPKIQSEALWIITNITSGTSEETQTILDADALPDIMRLMKSSDNTIKENCVWTIGNIAGDSVHNRNIIHSLNGLDAISKMLGQRQLMAIVKVATWTISNLLRGKPHVPIEVCRQAIPMLSRLVHTVDIDTIVDACCGLAYISSIPDGGLEILLESGAVSRLIDLMKTGEERIQEPVIRCLGAIAVGSEAQTQVLLNLGAIPVIVDCMYHRDPYIQKDTLWTLSNIAAGSIKQVACLFESNGSSESCIERTIDFLRSGAPYKLVKEALFILTNSILGGSEEQALRIATLGAIPALGCALREQEADVRALEFGLNALRTILQRAKDRGSRTNSATLKNVTDVFYSTDVISAIENLQMHPNEKIYESAHYMLREFFNAEVGDDADVHDNDDLAPEMHGEQFSFGTGNVPGSYDM